MKGAARRAARVFAVLVALLYALFALDTAVLSVGFLVHLIPAAIVLALTVTAWSRPGFGARGFAVAAALSVPFFRTWTALERFLLLTLPLLLIAALFLMARDRHGQA